MAIDYSHPTRRPASPQPATEGPRVLQRGEAVNLSELARQGASRASLSGLADEAYGAGVSSANPMDRAYAAGVEDLARHLAGQVPASPRLGAILATVRFGELVRTGRR